MTITGTGGDIALTAKNLTTSTVEAKAKQTDGGETGAGVSVALNIVDTSTDARLGNGAALTGGDLTLQRHRQPLGDHQCRGRRRAARTARASAARWRLPWPTTPPRRSSARAQRCPCPARWRQLPITTVGSTTAAKGDGTGTSTAAGAALALSFVGDSALALAARDLTAGKGVNIAARGDGASKAQAIASAKGADKSRVEQHRRRPGEAADRFRQREDRQVEVERPVEPATARAQSASPRRSR